MKIGVRVLWPAGYSTDARQVIDAERWAIRDGCLVVDVVGGGSHIFPLTSVARIDVPAL